MTRESIEWSYDVKKYNVLEKNDGPKRSIACSNMVIAGEIGLGHAPNTGAQSW